MMMGRGVHVYFLQNNFACINIYALQIHICMIVPAVISTDIWQPSMATYCSGAGTCTFTVAAIQQNIWKCEQDRLMIIHTYFLTFHSRVLLEKLIGVQLVKKIPTFYGTWEFITAFTSARHLSLSWASSIQSIPSHPTSWRSILILSSHLHLGLPSGLFPSGFPTKTLYMPHLSPIRATCPAHLILLHFITRMILDAEYRSLSSSFCSFLHSPLPRFS